MQSYITRQIVVNDCKKDKFCDDLCNNIKDKVRCEKCCNKCIYDVNNFKLCIKDCMKNYKEKKYIIKSNGK